ncbi:hypothetical protein CWB96_20875 [Pseudoalteromonas citrea]|uniref:Uncharacterized protein n=1 Tax=Pseudoalteromonas citrea TaxID=43655 RepID=A0A5S3XJJ8_9GAMM|nr:hypothetical protein [Pseudoalteromonas citrea]TMP39133.1 hypothetical protein CWB97_21160 [Pseudoalteromonas citrea]TMP53612.1 hypothetical protein CWB96_20875 [Pseudoalteromonas citrea]
MKLLPLVCAISTACLLTACGGSSSSNDNVATTDTSAGTPPPTNTVTPPPTPVSEYDISFTSVIENDCGIAPIASSLIFHDQQGQAIEAPIIKQDGQFQHNVPDNTHYISIIATQTDESNQKQTEIITINNQDDISSDLALGTVTFKGYQSCGCDAVNFDFSELAVTNPGYTVTGFSDNVVLANNPSTLALCANALQEKLLFIKNENTGDVRGGLFSFTDPKNIVLTDADFPTAGVAVNTAQHAQTNEYVIISASTSELLSREQSRYARFSDTPLYIFPDIVEQSYITSYLEQTSSQAGISVTIASFATNTIDDTGTYNTLSHIKGSHELAAAFAEFGNSFNDASQSVTYDFGNADQRVNEVTVTLRWQDQFNGNVSWAIRGKTQASIAADLSFGNYLNESTAQLSNPSLSVTLAAHQFNGDFATLQRLRTEPLSSNEIRDLLAQSAFLNITADQ